MSVDNLTSTGNWNEKKRGLARPRGHRKTRTSVSPKELKEEYKELSFHEKRRGRLVLPKGGCYSRKGDVNGSACLGDKKKVPKRRRDWQKGRRGTNEKRVRGRQRLVTEQLKERTAAISICS